MNFYLKERVNVRAKSVEFVIEQCLFPCIKQNLAKSICFTIKGNAFATFL